jgi:cobalt/nickel transport system permease protein
MHVDAFDHFHHKHSPVHNLDPRIKVLVTVAFILSNALLPDGSWPAFALAWLVLLAANDQADLGLAYTFKRSFVALPFALVAVSAIFSLTTVIAFLFRYLFILTDEVFRILRARESRSAGLPGQIGGGSLIWRARITGSMAGQLFLRSYDRSDRIYHAMISRGYAGHLRTLNPHVMLPWLVLMGQGNRLYCCI